ncbi:uncharacterized protein LOC126821388 [Patella vulgata]|uniref:uncharacterized protein LOC126821388 n=1 Tax=Patella vulgata TaxID=6465 RepID=UPI00217FEF14|nr:uncharacterized protein LOC126821388 [Patella vulgata]
MSWVMFGSPLWKTDKVSDGIKPLPGAAECKDLEDKFVNDGIKTEVQNFPRNQPIIPPYNAVKDVYAQAYFQSPVVKGIFERNEALKNFKEEKSRISHNKLSARKRCPITPNDNELKLREQKFINDGIITERSRTKYKDIIPDYDATKDHHSNHYTKRADVKRLLAVTCTPRGK